MTTIAVDCMGGDHGLSVTIPAALNFLLLRDNAKLILVGKKNEIEAALAANPQSADVITRLSVHNANEVVGMCETPQLALKNKKDSSMRVSINLVKEELADACVSAGNTGALMATARYVLKMLPAIDRPAICAVLPTMSGRCYMLDLGANVDCSAQYLLHFAIMGSALVSVLEDKQTPKVGLLNIGEEAIKGNEVVKEASNLLAASELNFIGNVEGDGIYKGIADVVVCDGFVGNSVLKASEGLAQLFSKSLKDAFQSNLYAKFVAFLALPLLKKFKKSIDHREYNGAVLLGLRGITVKSHGSADQYSFKNALDRAYLAAEHRLLERTNLMLHKLLQQSSINLNNN